MEVIFTVVFVLMVVKCLVAVSIFVKLLLFEFIRDLSMFLVDVSQSALL